MALPLKVSVQTFNEIAALCEQQGIKVHEGKSLMLEKGTHLVPPIDFRLVTVRRDAVTEASKSYKPDVHGENFVAYASEVYKFILDNEVAEPVAGIKELPPNKW